MPVLALPVLAGLTPAEHEVVLIDENVQEIDFDAARRLRYRRPDRDDGSARPDARHLARAPGPRHLRGDRRPWITVAEDWFRGLVDVMFVGEAEETWPKFLEDWARNDWKPRYEQAGKDGYDQGPAPAV